MDEVESAGSEGDVAVDLANGVTLFLAPAAWPSCAAPRSTMPEGVNRSLKFNNPNVTAECGCGESFSVE